MMRELVEEKITQLLGKNAALLFSKLADSPAKLNKVREYLLHVEKSFFGIKKSAYADDSTALTQYLKTKIFSAEKKIIKLIDFGDPHTVEGLSRTAFALQKEIPPEESIGFFLKDETIITLLEDLPPSSLLNHYNMETCEVLFSLISPRNALALTRHTENDDWQYSYHKKLQSLAPESFEERQIAHFVVDSASINSLFKKNNHAIKPWRLSHNKETGTVLFFTVTPNDHPSTPYLLQTSVFNHYYEEIRFASGFFDLCSNDPRTFGERVSTLIQNNRRSFDFLTDKNVFDETLYWDKALERMTSSLLQESLALFRDTSSIGTTEEGKIISLNLVDVLWDLNLQNKNLGYFSKPESSFTYHFKESFFTDLVYLLSTLYKEEIIQILKKNLDSNDTTLLKLFISPQGLT